MRSSVLVLALMAGCGGDGMTSGDDVPPGGPDPKVIAGGGVADAPIAGTLHVHVVETGGSTPIASATVVVGSETKTTDATGLASFAVSGAQTITATATGHAAATWIGVAGANATLPLDVSAAVPTAHASGTIAGWNNLPSPSFGHYTLGVVTYSFLDDPGAPENSLVQPAGSNGAPKDTCLNTGLSNTCAWELVTRVGLQIHTAVIVDGNTNGTSNDTSDDTYTLIGYAAGTQMTLSAGQTVANESLAMVSATAPLSVSFPSAPAGLSHVVAIPELALGAAGRIVFPLPTVSPGKTSTTVLAATGALAGHYEIVALASPSATATSPYSSAFIHDASGSATLPAWLAAPTISPSGAMFAFTGDGDFHTAQFTRSGQTLWNVTVLDGSSAFTLPTVTPDPLGSGSTQVAMTVADVPGFDAKKFDVPAVKTSLVRAAGAQATFTR